MSKRRVLHISYFLLLWRNKSVARIFPLTQLCVHQVAAICYKKVYKITLKCLIFLVDWCFDIKTNVLLPLLYIPYHATCLFSLTRYFVGFLYSCHNVFLATWYTYSPFIYHYYILCITVKYIRKGGVGGGGSKFGPMSYEFRHILNK